MDLELLPEAVPGAQQEIHVTMIYHHKHSNLDGPDIPL